MSRQLARILASAVLVLGVTAAARAAAGANEEATSARLSEAEMVRQARQRVAQVKLPGDLKLEYDWALPFDDRLDAGNVWIRKDSVLVLIDRTQLYCIGRNNGVMMWAIDLGNEMEFAPAVSEQTVYVFVRGKLVAIDKVAGKIAWRVEPEFAASGAPCVMEPHLYVPAFDKRVYAVEVRSRKRVYVRGVKGEESLSDTEHYLWTNWHKTAAGHIAGSPIVFEGIIYFASEEGYVYSLTPEGEQRFRRQVQGAIRVPVTGRGGEVYVGSTDFNAYGLDRLTGLPQWIFPTGSNVLQPVCADPASGVAIVVSNNNGIYGILDRPVAERGTEIWHIPDAEYVAGVGPERVYLMLTDNRLAAVDKETGTVRWLSLLDGIRDVVVNVDNSTDKDDRMRLLCVSSAIPNQLVCLKESDEDLRRAVRRREEKKEAE